ncbi:hypothetical protein B0H13DRAFT_2026608 [Mycena leptocephala]|nr:hypothetical protein B0H13DRAFT_2026608 [Mycena leptocephala]
MHSSSVWRHLSRVAVTYKSSALFDRSLVMFPYIDMIQTIATKPEWRSAVYPELPSWITVLSGGDWDYTDATLTSVFRDIWVPEFDEQHQFTHDSEHFVALALTALSNVWEVHDFRTSPVVERFLQLARCTVSMSLASGYHHDPATDSWSVRQELPPNLMLLFSAPLFKSMKKAAANARNTILSEGMSPNKKHYLEGMAELLDTLAESLAKECESSHTKAEVEGPRQDHNVWEDLKKNLLGKIDAFEESLGAEHGG